MTDKEFKRLGRSQLIDIIYQFQLKQEELIADNEKLEKELADKRLRISKAGSIAEAALELHNVMASAQDAAALYLEEIRIMRDETTEECQRLLEQARTEAERIVAQARTEAESIAVQASSPRPTVSSKPKASGKKKHKKKKSTGGRK